MCMAAGADIGRSVQDGKIRKEEMGLQPVFCIFIIDDGFSYGAGSAEGQFE